MSTKDAPEVDEFVIGDGNVHVHTCPQGPHQWRCDSAYCNSMPIRCPNHGGPVPKLNSSR